MSARPRTLLLDLDGTLVDVDMGRFLDGFFRLAAERFAPPFRRGPARRALTEAARGMFASHDPERTLDRVFLESLAPALGRTVEETRAELDAFHRGELEGLARHVRPIPGALELLEAARARGCELVLATNPVFFREAILARVRWGGLAGVPFALVTDAETMHSTKPHAEYYAQVLALAGRRPGECLMVGDNPLMDLTANQVGIPTWLAVRAGAKPPPADHADHVGTIADLAAWLEG